MQMNPWIQLNNAEIVSFNDAPVCITLTKIRSLLLSDLVLRRSSKRDNCNLTKKNEKNWRPRLDASYLHRFVAWSRESHSPGGDRLEVSKQSEGRRRTRWMSKDSDRRALPVSREDTMRYTCLPDCRASLMTRNDARGWRFARELVGYQNSRSSRSVQNKNKQRWIVSCAKREFPWRPIVAVVVWSLDRVSLSMKVPTDSHEPRF